MATIIDVAKEAGVSTATVSRVMNGSGMVSDAAREAVREAAGRLGYKLEPKMHKESVDKAILVIGSIQMPNLEEAIIDAAVSENISPVFIYAQSTPADDLYLNGTIRLLEKNLVGIITTGDPSWFSGIKLNIPAGIPLVATSEDPADERIYYVGSDNIRIGYDATQYLIRQGCRRIASVAAVNDRIHARKMIQGYQLALLENGITPDPSLCYEEDFVRRISGEDPVAPLMAQIDPASPPDGVFCVIDLMADDIYDALAGLGLKVPEDVKIAAVGRGDFYSDTKKRFPLPLIENDYEAIGREAVKKIISLYASGEEGDGALRTLVRHRPIEE
ncbi:MAG: LacI family DNA-binding transcriptional regulator [Lachnospiraceae bacterium]|nr:LacI family DNA-binding transcriptional regulator [Lachnospiraceae bacterium]